MVGTLIRGCRFATSWCDFDLFFDLSIVMLTYNILSVLYLGNCNLGVGSSYFVGTLAGNCSGASHCVTLI